MIAKRYTLTFMILSVLIGVSNVQSQQLEERKSGAIEIVAEKSNAPHNNFMNLKRMPVDDFFTVDPAMKWGHSQEWDNPQINFTPSAVSQPAGDLDGDGTEDFIQIYYAWDERTVDPSDQVYKTLIFMGSGDQINPDIVIYNQLIPIGDILGAGQSQLIGQSDGKLMMYQFSLDGSFSSSEVSIPALEDVPVDLNEFQLIGKDIDGNSIQDLIAASGDMIYIGLMDDPLENSIVMSFNLNTILDTPEPRVLNIGYVSWDGIPYLVTVLRSANDFRNDLAVFSLDIENLEIELVQNMTIAQRVNTTRIHLIEDADGFPNILASGVDFGSENSGPFAKLFTQSSGDGLYADSPRELGPYEMWSAGDLNGNGRTDFIVDFEGSYSYGILRNDTTLSVAGSLGYAEDESNTLAIPNNFYPQGDLTNNDRDDFQYYLRNENQFGHLRIEGVESAGTPGYDTPAEYLQLVDEFRITRIKRSFGLGDISGNGLEEYAYNISDGVTETLDIYEGGSNGATPLYTFELDGSVIDVTSGDFNTDGRNDLLIFLSTKVEVDGVIQWANELQFYEMSAEEPYHVITGEDYQPTEDNTDDLINLIANAGDVNNDGLDDVLVSAASASNAQPIGLYYGGGNMSHNPDQEISFSEEEGILYGFGWGGTMQGKFDVNGDGIDDFLIGNIGEYNANDLPEGATFVNDGVVHIYYGQDGNADFSGDSDVRLVSDTTAYDKNIYYWLFGFNEIATGDFNGDGSTDLAVKPFRHHDNADLNEGKPGIHIFHGGDDFDGHADQVIPLLKEIHHPTLVGEGNNYHAFSGRAAMAGVPDVNGDGADELLYMGNSGDTNGSFFYGGNTFSHTPDAVIKAPNQSRGFNQNGNFINRQYRMTIGQFTAEGVTSVIGEQPSDLNYRDTPAYLYELTQIPVSTEQIVSDVPETYDLEQNYPNPFNPTTNIQFTVPKSSEVTLKVYNVLGQEVMTLVNEFLQAGTHNTIFEAGNLSSGMYVYRIQAGEFVQTRKMMLIK